MDHLLSKEKKRGICLVLSVLEREDSEKIIENWIIKKKLFYEKEKDKMKRMRLEKRKIKVDSSGRKVKN